MCEEKIYFLLINYQCAFLFFNTDLIRYRNKHFAATTTAGLSVGLTFVTILQKELYFNLIAS